MSRQENDTVYRRAAIDALEAYAKKYNAYPIAVYDAVGVLHRVPSVQLGTNLAEVGTRAVRGYPIDADALMEKVAEEYGERARDTLYRIIRDMPPAQQNLSEEYAKAVKNWLVNYQIKCAELKGRYTPYEVLGWIVSDWRKENGIW